MPLQFSAAHSSRIKKASQRHSPFLKRASSSPSKRQPRHESLHRSHSSLSGVEPEEEGFNDVLQDASPVNFLGEDTLLRDVIEVIEYVKSYMFEDIPEAGGFNSVRIAEILNYRKSLPHIVTTAHIHALTSSPTRTEKEILKETKSSRIRRFNIPGRGSGRTSIGEGLCLTKDVDHVVRETQVDSVLGGKYGRA